MASLEAVRADLADLRARLGTLEEVEALLASLYETPQTPAEPPVVKRSRPAPVKARRYLRRDEVRAFIAKRGPVSSGQIAEEFGARRKAVARMLKALIDDGEIAADGPVQNRRFRASSAKPAPERGMYPLYDALRDLGGTATTKQLAEAAGLTVADVVDQGQDLERFGYVGRIPVGRGHRWVVTDDVVGP
jgi:hypothetical protein